MTGPTVLTRGTMSERLDWANFWPFYLEEHNVRKNRWMHFVGTTIAAVAIVLAAALGQPWLLLGALLSGYAFAWIGHAVFQKNRPATFRYPIKSFVSDWRLWALMLVGRAEREYEKHAIEQV